MRKLATILQRTALLIMVMVLSLNVLTLDGDACMWPTNPSNLNIQTYTLYASSNVNVYSTSSRTSRIGSIYPGDLITVLKAQGDSAYVRYPISGGKTREGWIALSTLSAGKLNSSYSLAMRANGSVKMYRRETGSETIGSISAGDIVYLVYAGTRHGDGTGRAQFIYPVGNGNQWKIGWAVFSDIENADFRACGGSAVLPDGDYQVYVSNTYRYRVDGLGGDGTGVHVWEALDVSQQILRFRHQGNGMYSIEFGTGLFLDQKGGGTEPSTLIRYAWHGGSNQLWYVADLGNGAYGIFNVNSGLALDVFGYQTENNGSDIQAYRFNGQRVYLNASSAANTGTTTSTSSTKMSYGLYKNTSARISCGFDGYTTTSGRHEGIDITCYNGAPVYALVSGTVVRVAYGSNGSSGLSTIAIYDSSTNKTVVYLHTNPLSTLYVGKSISKGDQIATQGWRGVSSASAGHTHVEVRNGRQGYAAKSVGDYTLDNQNPTRYWTSKGYTIQ